MNKAIRIAKKILFSVGIAVLVFGAIVFLFLFSETENRLSFIGVGTLFIAIGAILIVLSKRARTNSSCESSDDIKPKPFYKIFHKKYGSGALFLSRL